MPPTSTKPNTPKPAPKRAAKRGTAPPRAALHSASAQMGAQVIGLQEAIRRRPRPTKRVGWGLFQDDVRRGRLISLAGVAGLNIFLVDPQAVAAHLSQSAFIKGVSVETALPNQVIIHVEERRPSVVWVLKDNTPYLISEDGILMSQATTLDGYVVVYDQESDPASFTIGMPLEHEDAVDTAQRLYMMLPPATGMHISMLEWQNATGGITV